MLARTEGAGRHGRRPAAGTVLIVGALGVVGRAVLEHFEAQEGWEVVAVARRAPEFETRARFLSVDLTNRDSCLSRLDTLRGVTRVVYAALFEKPELGRGWLEQDQIATNRAMLANLLDAVEPANPSLHHIALMQGVKAYGVHLGQMPIPGKESARATSTRISIGPRRISCASAACAAPPGNSPS
jgi:nucleoside-diphosphate-sugar epimerase